MTTDVHRGALEAVERLLNRGGDADDVLRAVVSALRDRLPHLERIAIEFTEGNRRVAGPSAGETDHDAIGLFPVVFQGAEVAAIAVPSSLLREGDATLLERVATIISPYCLVGWDTGGKRWEP